MPEDAFFVEPGFVDPGFVAETILPRFGPFAVEVRSIGAPYAIEVLTPAADIEELT